MGRAKGLRALLWVAVREVKLSCHNPETILFAIYPLYGDLNKLLNSNPVVSIYLLSPLPL